MPPSPSAGQSGNFQLNVMLPVIAYNLLQSLELLGIACRNLADHAIAGFKVNEERLREALERNPILVTALNPHDRLREGRRHRQEGLRAGPAHPRCRRGDDRYECRTSCAVCSIRWRSPNGGVKGSGSAG